MMKNTVYIVGMAKAMTERERADIGQRLASFRKKAGMSQAQLGKAVGLPQRTIANYETVAKYIPSNVLLPLAEALDVSIEELLGVPPPKGGRRGPKSEIEKQIAALRRLPKRDQELASQLLDRLLSSAR
jgi:transcriptional regulator with XRE-family HTH domain